MFNLYNRIKKEHRMVMETLAITGLTIAGRTIFSQMIFDTYNVMKETAWHPVVNAKLIEIDLEADLQVIEALLKQIEDHHYIKQSPVAICLAQVKNLIELIKKDLDKIDDELKAHQEKYLANWRTPDYAGHLANIVKNKKVLDRRVEMLIKLAGLSQ